MVCSARWNDVVVSTSPAKPACRSLTVLTKAVGPAGTP
jgi:hypothetical protein